VRAPFEREFFRRSLCHRSAVDNGVLKTEGTLHILRRFFRKNCFCSASPLPPGDTQCAARRPPSRPTQEHCINRLLLASALGMTIKRSQAIRQFAWGCGRGWQWCPSNAGHSQTDVCVVEWSNDWLLVVSKPKPQRTRGGFCQGHHCLPLFWCPFSGLGHFSRESALPLSLSLSLRMETNAEESITDTPHSQHDRKNAPSQQPKNQKQKTTRLMMACLVGASASEPKADPETAPLAQ
jgi:hypothetical protein